MLQYLSLVLPPFPFYSILLYIFLFSSNPLLPFLLLSSSIFSLSITQLSIIQPSITQLSYYSALLFSDISTSINTLDFSLNTNCSNCKPLIQPMFNQMTNLVDQNNYFKLGVHTNHGITELSTTFQVICLRFFVFFFFFFFFLKKEMYQYMPIFIFCHIRFNEGADMD